MFLQAKVLQMATEFSTFVIDMTLKEFFEEWNSASDEVLVHTSGSTGEPKPMRVSKQRMLASARATCDFLGLQRGDKALLCLPLDYIAGKMVVVRAIERGLTLIEGEANGHPLVSLSSKIKLAAMVPMQVYNTLEVEEEAARLRHIEHLLIGGGAIDDKLEHRIRSLTPDTQPHPLTPSPRGEGEACGREGSHIPEHLNDQTPKVWCTYGMTETLSHVALRRVNGPDASLWYTPLPGVSVSLSHDNTLIIDYPQVCDKPLHTHDVAVLRSMEDSLTGRTITQFRILGRTDNIICSGGLKIQAEEVEGLLRGKLPVPYIITSCRDEKLGEKVVLLAECMNESECESICRSALPHHYVPRKFVFVDSIPMTANGKVARAEARKIVVS